jgi:hypothetical protein
MTEPLYVPPSGDEPLDLVEQALVRMWIDIIEQDIREELAHEHRDLDQGGAGDDRHLGHQDRILGAAARS